MCFGGVGRLLMNYHVLLFMSVVVTSQCLNVVYIVVSNCLLSRTAGGSISPSFKLYFEHSVFSMMYTCLGQ